MNNNNPYMELYSRNVFIVMCWVKIIALYSTPLEI